ncbi:MAG TPA: cation-transporting P-type ATPase, partial [Stellaceae bacterium]|nr:cation-transporting P-type ATPase [Stellaceae bacterium]
MVASLVEIPGLMWRQLRPRPPAAERRASNGAASPYHRIAALDAEQALQDLATTADGLTEGEAAERLLREGPNAVAQEVSRSIPVQLLIRFGTPLNFMLLALALASYLLGDPRAAIMIAIMVVLSVGLSFIQEYRSNRAAAALRAMVRTTAT